MGTPQSYPLDYGAAISYLDVLEQVKVGGVVFEVLQDLFVGDEGRQPSVELVLGKRHHLLWQVGPV